MMKQRTTLILLITVAIAVMLSTSTVAAETKQNPELTEYRKLQHRLEQLGNHKQQLEQRIDKLQQQTNLMAGKLQNIPSYSRFNEMLQQMVNSLHAFVMADLPFHRDDRLNKVEQLKQLIGQLEVTPVEKLRQVLKTYQRETEYGRTIEAYDGELVSNDGKKRLVTYLRYGRIALVYQTFDGKESAYWDKSDKSWKQLDSDFAGEVKKGIRVAQKRIPPDLLILPVAGSKQ